ncbi:MAG: gamma-glutamyl-gamma-aminobutyrate hydrolase family protein, partial [Patescibacteria group bacterium]
MKHKIKVLFFDILTPDLKQRELFNKEIYRGSTYSETTRKMVGLKPESWVYCDATLGIFPEDITQFDGVIIGGSTGDPVVGHEKPWIKKTYPYIRKIVKKGIPLLGICGGLQFTVRALGGEVIFNPKGKEFGTIRVEV